MPKSTRLFGDGKHGHGERIQTFRGPACHTTFSARRTTPLSRLKTPSHHVAMVLSVLAEGLDPSEAERVFGFRQATITSLFVPRGLARTNLARAVLLPSPPPAPPIGRTANPAPLRHTGASFSGWLSTLARAILPVLALGPRTQHIAHRVIHSLRQLLAPGCLPLFSSDGLNLSFSALTAHFGTWPEEKRRGRNIRRWQVAACLIYGQVKKC